MAGRGRHRADPRARRRSSRRRRSIGRGARERPRGAAHAGTVVRLVPSCPGVSVSRARAPPGLSPPDLAAHRRARSCRSGAAAPGGASRRAVPRAGRLRPARRSPARTRPASGACVEQRLHDPPGLLDRVLSREQLVAPVHRVEQQALVRSGKLAELPLERQIQVHAFRRRPRRASSPARRCSPPSRVPILIVRWLCSGTSDPGVALPPQRRRRAGTER